MKNPIRTLLLLPALCIVLLGGCSSISQKDPQSLYDLGLLTPLTGKAAGPVPGPISVAEAIAPAWLDSRQMFYRLAYEDAQQPRPYASSRWSFPPGDMFLLRLKSRIGQAGGVVLSSSDGALNVPLLRIEADDFSQVFTSPSESVGIVTIRASVYNGRNLVGQKTFVQRAPAPTANAAGGARALAAASDAMITDMMQWLASLPLQR